MKQLTKKQTLQLCKESRFLPNKLRQKFCGCLCCETEEGGEELPVFSFFGKIRFNICTGRCSDVPFPEGDGNVLIYTTSPVFELSQGFFIPLDGALLFYDEALTLPVTDLGSFTIAFTWCRFGYVTESNEFYYTFCP